MALALAGAALVANADTLTWDPGANGGAGGNGTWNFNSALNWWNGSGDVRWTDNSPAGTNSAVFGGTAGTVTLASSLSASNLQFTTPGYTLSGLGMLTLGGGGIDASSLGSGTTTLSVSLSLAGPQQMWQAGLGSVLAINSTVTRLAGAAVDFSSAGITSSSLNNVNGILGGWATVGAAVDSMAGDWAANDGSGNIVTYAGYTAVSGTGSTTQTGAGAATQNWLSGDPTGANNYITTLSSSATLNSLVMQGDFALNAGVTLNLGSGGLLLRGGSRWLLGGSPTTCFLTSGASTGELFVHVPDLNSGNNWTIWPIIEDNGTTPVQLIKDGVGMAKVGNQSTYTGGTIVNNGILAYTGNAEYGQGSGATGTVTPFGTGSITVNNGAQLQLGCNVGGNNFSAFVLANPITLNGSVLYENDGFFHVAAPLTIGAQGATLGATYDNKGDALNAGFAKGLFVDGIMTGTGDITVQQTGLETANPWDSSTVYFTSTGTAAQNTYSGTITVNPFAAQGGSYLFVVGTNALANATINLTGDNDPSNGRFGSPTLLFGSGTNLDGVGYATIGGLMGSGNFVLADTLVTQSGSSIGGPFALTVGNNNSSSTYSGVMSGAGSLTKVGAGTLTLSSANTYTGDTFVNGGTLALPAAFVNSTNFGIGTGATLDISALGTVTIPGNLVSGGTVNGSVNLSTTSKLYAGTDGGYGTNAITGSLSLPSGVLIYLDLGTVHNATNDLITVGGTLVANGNIIHLKAPSTSAMLDTTADYLLMNAPGGITGSFSAGPDWDVAPANAAHYTIVTGPTTVTLHYSATTAGPTAVGSVSPSTALRNQSVAITVYATNGSPGTVSSVTVDASPLGGSSSFALTKSSGSGANSVWTGTLIVTPGTGAGAKVLVATVTDTSTLTTTVNLPLTVVVGNDVWGGGGGNANFSTALNWTNQLAPGYVGDSLEFAGSTQLSPNLDNNYSVTSLLFDSGAGSFSIGGANTLTLTGGLTNNSASNEAINTPLAFSAAQTVNAAGNIALGGVIAGAGSLTKVGTGVLTLSGTGNTFSGNLGVLGGTLNVSGGSTAFTNTSLCYAGYRANSGNLTISGGSFTTGGELWIGGSDLSGTAYNAVGTLTISGGANVSLGKLTIGRGNNSQNTVSGAVTLNGGTVSSENDLLMGFAGAGTALLTVNSGTVNVATATKRWIIVGQWDGTSSVIDMNGGQMNVNANTDIRFATGNNSSTNVFNLNSGAVTFYSDNATTIGGTGVVDLHQGTAANVVDIFNLNGGILTVSGVTVANSAGTAAFNFNGGTLKANGANNAFLGLGTGNAVANVRTGGAIIDDGGFAIEVPQALVHSTIAGDSAVDGGLTKMNVGTLTLSGANTYNGATAITAGTLALFGSGSLSSSNIVTSSSAIFDVSGVAFTLANDQGLSGFGVVNGTVNAAAGSKLYGGTDGTYGTNSFNNDLVLASGAACYFDLGTAYNGPNDQIIVNGTVTANGNPIHIKAPSTAVNFDSTADYVLITSPNPISGTFASVPVWDVPPANAGHFSVVTSGSTVLLRYSAVAAPIVTASARPSALLRNQSTVITANVLPGSSAISSVTVDLTPLGGSVTSLIQSNATSYYTNSATIPGTMNAGGVTLNVTATDISARSGSASVPLTVTVSTEVWSGGGNGNWSANADWASGSAPGLAGDAVLFAGSLGLTPNMDASYSLTGLSFSNNASSFSIGTANSSTLTLTGGIVDNSPNPQTVNVPITLSGSQATVNATAGSITLGGVITGSGNLSKIGDGTLALSAPGNTFSGNVGVLGGTLNVTGGSTTFGNVLSYAGYDTSSGSLTVSGGSFSNGGEFWVGGSDQNGSANNAFGTLTLSGAANVSVAKLSIARGNWFDNTVSGTVTVNGGTLSSENDILMGFAGAGTGKLIINGGTVNIASSTVRWVILSQWDTANSEIDVNGGQFNINANTAIRFAINGNTGTNTFNLNGGAVTFYSDNATTIGGTGVLDLHQGNGTTVVNTFNLNGGTLTVPGIYAANSSGTRTFNFNGGTLKATTNNTTFVGLGTGSAVANVRNGGAIIDDSGYAVTIAQPLLHSGIAGDNAIDGGLTKLGSGTVTLGSGSSYNGNTTVEAGTLEVVLATLATNSTVSISNGATLQLDFTTTNLVGGLVLAGVAQAPGVYNSTTAAPYITGGGSLRVVSTIPSTPTNLTCFVSGNTLTFSWPSNYLGWILQTNAVGIAASNAWFTYPGSSAVTTESITIIPSQKNVFFRLSHP